VALFILALACVNFMNLVAARSTQRAREVGIRKVHGAVTSRLVTQFLGESLIQSFCALVLGLGLAQLGLPIFRSIVRIDLPSPFAEASWLLPGAVGLALLVGLAAGSYPAFVLSSFRAADVLKGGLRGGPSKSRFRGALVVFQFAVSVLLIIMTGVIFGQVRFMRNMDLGFDRERVVVVRLGSPEARRSAEALKQEFRRLPGVVSVGASSHAPDWGAHHNVCQPEGFELDESPGMGIISIDHDYLEAMGIDVLRGRGFAKDFPGDAGTSVLINETAARSFGWDDPVGKRIRELDDQGIYKTVVGVVRDFHFMDIRRLIEPMMIDYGPADVQALVVRLGPGEISGRTRGLEQVWKTVMGGIPLDYYFLEGALDAEFRPEENLAAQFTTFSLLAVFIACLGLVGMAAFTTEQRTKEIGIRKVLGASSAKLVFILNRDMGKFILIANVIAWPLAYLAAGRWLRDFAYRTSIPLWVFGAAAALVLIVGLLTTSYHSVRAARRPRELRTNREGPAPARPYHVVPVGGGRPHGVDEESPMISTQPVSFSRLRLRPFRDPHPSRGGGISRAVLWLFEHRSPFRREGPGGNDTGDARGTGIPWKSSSRAGVHIPKWPVAYLLFARGSWRPGPWCRPER
jgi:putative ABC transport system permease protein